MLRGDRTPSPRTGSASLAAVDPTAPGRRLLRPAGVFAGIFIVLLAGLLFAPAAFAHSVVVSSDPADGGRLAKVPATVAIHFDEPVGLSLGYLRVVDSVGRRVDSGTPSHPGGDGTAIAVGLKPGFGGGGYLASFRVISADSHPIAGSIRFVVGNGPLPVAGAAPSTDVARGVSVALGVAHWLSFAGVSLVGGSWLIFTVWPAGQRRARVRRAIWTGWAVAAFGAVAEYFLQGPYAAGTSIGSLTDTVLLDATLHVNSGQMLSLRLVLLGVLGAVLTALFNASEHRRPSWGPEAAAIVGLGIVITFAATGHSQSANPRWFAVLVDGVHLAATIIWLGGLAILLTAAVGRSDQDDDRTELAAGLTIFSRVAVISVVSLVVTGTVQAWRELGTIDAITTTWYGRLVLTKVVLFGAIVGLGYLSRRVLQRSGIGVATLTRLRRTVVTEIVVGAAVLAAAGVLIAQPPGKVALAAQRSKPRSATVAVTSKSQAQVEIAPGAHGSVQVVVVLLGDIAPVAVTATASLPARQLGPIPIGLQAAGPMSYTASDVILPVAGIWEITLVVKTSQFEATTTLARVRLS